MTMFDIQRSRQRPMPLRSSLSDDSLGLVPGAKPLRLTARRRSPPSSIRGWFASPKALGEAPFESLLERDAQAVISADPQVEAYAVQCHRLTYFVPTANGLERRNYVPDLVLKMRDGRRIIVEVKASALAEQPAWTKLEPYIRRAYEDDYDAQFRLITERHIRRQPQLSNAQVMLAHCGAPDPKAELAVLQVLDAEHGLISIRGLSEVMAQLGLSYEQTFTTVMKCAFAGKVEVDTTEPYSPSSQVWAL
ncbi:TnsA endonuclease N-terminal domain-containing protein [Brevundimonas vesicularis]|uniref:TnsA endonuclease N-terminal domain-containing protein n=1 Tax=Brevundimonas TaxID=41275 RepID=UPI0038D37270